MAETFTCSYCKQTVPFSPSAMHRHQTNPSPDAIAPSCMATPIYTLDTACVGPRYAARIQPADDYDPTPWCSGCNAMRKVDCKCGPIAENE